MLNTIFDKIKDKHFVVKNNEVIITKKKIILLFLYLAKDQEDLKSLMNFLLDKFIVKLKDAKIEKVQLKGFEIKILI